jgi:hypothetical protein
MSGTHITDRQVHLYMTKRKDHAQEVAAAKAGMSVRTARRITKATELPSQKPERDWRTRTNPFADVWDSVRGARGGTTRNSIYNKRYYFNTVKSLNLREPNIKMRLEFYPSTKKILDDQFS